MLLPEDFFSLDEFAHKDLWEKEEPVWSALQRLKEYLRRDDFQIEIEIPEGVFLKNPKLISIGSGTIIEPGVMIQGPCIIGKNCIIRHGAYIREYVILADHIHIGHASEIKGSILLNRAAVTHFVYLGDSIVGNAVNLGAGVKCANLRLDRDEVKIYFDGKKYGSGLKKFGAIIGDEVQIGCNCVLNPGTLIGKHCICYPMINLSGVIPEKHQISKRGFFPINQKNLTQFLCASSNIDFK